MCSFHYVSDFSSYTEVLCNPKTALILCSSDDCLSRLLKHLCYFSYSILYQSGQFWYASTRSPTQDPTHKRLTFCPDLGQCWRVKKPRVRTPGGPIEELWQPTLVEYISTCQTMPMNPSCFSMYIKRIFKFIWSEYTTKAFKVNKTDTKNLQTIICTYSTVIFISLLFVDWRQFSMHLQSVYRR